MNLTSLLDTDQYKRSNTVLYTNSNYLENEINKLPQTHSIPISKFNKISKRLQEKSLKIIVQRNLIVSVNREI